MTRPHGMVWNVGMFWLVYLIAFGWALVSEIPMAIVEIQDTASLHTQTLIGLFGEGVAVLVMILLYRKRPWLTGLRITRHALSQYAVGIATGTGLFALIWAVVWFGGDLAVSVVFAPTQWLLIGLYILAFAVQSLLEELLCRGYIMGFWLKQHRVGVAVLGNSAFFMFLHLGNPGFDWRAGIGIFLFGLLMSLFRLLSGGIWLSAGMHMAWNYAEGIIFGTSVSGMSDISLILHSTPLGNTWLDGGTFGIERGLPTTLVLLAAIAVVGWLIKLRNRADFATLE
ncbi:CPBP family intramembrane glutamic endopeptidase [Lacticaseibacillus jixiensis]|uniref:CPBP family intramembrane glutamic endopeptidase n=1 Tax=Lacticaseibacillus jixiensis TaxID=3231926 RepID=UPI0036F22459